MDSREIFRKNLMFYMDLNRRSQADLARYLDVTRATITMWYKGKAYPRIDKIQQIADFLGIRTDDLVSDSNKAVNALNATVSMNEDLAFIAQQYALLNDENRARVKDYINILLLAQKVASEVSE